MNIPPPSTGTLMPPRPVWEAFVQTVLKITIAAYYRLDQDRRAKAGWLEDQFNEVLAWYIDEEARPLKAGLVVSPQAHSPTYEMRTGKVHPRRAKRHDIKLYHIEWGSYHTVYFTWEAKRIGEMGTRSEYKQLNGAYIAEGMRRFIDAAYSKAVTEAGMLGYVISGSGSVIADEINSLMNEQGLTASDYLQPHPPINSFVSIYLSKHDRAGLKEPITVYHLMLRFNFTT